jgi:PAS domain S-box-containing protein
MPHSQALSGDLEAALSAVSVPTYMIDTTGVVRWINGAALELVGDVRGRQFTSVVADEDRPRSRELFARKIAGTAEVTDAEVVLLDKFGDRLSVEVTSVPLVEGGHVVGVFGQARQEAPAPDRTHPALTPRQTEVLGLLEQGHSTRQIAAELKLSPETVRNHVRGILHALGVHSRLEAVAVARRDHLRA